jgi:hypothetical protein
MLPLVDFGLLDVENILKKDAPHCHPLWFLEVVCVVSAISLRLPFFVAFFRT